MIRARLFLFAIIVAAAALLLTAIAFTADASATTKRNAQKRLRNIHNNHLHNNNNNNNKQHYFKYSDDGGVPLRYLSINVGNFGISCWESKLCEPQVVKNIREYIAEYQPDIILIMELMLFDQLMGTAVNGPLLPEGYEGLCDLSIDRFTGEPATWNATNASHEHECIAWKTSRLRYVNGTAHSVFGRNDAYGQKECNYDFTSFRAVLELMDASHIEDPFLINAIAVHPDSTHKECRQWETSQYWDVQTAGYKNSIMAGDWNAGIECTLGVCKNTTAETNFPANNNTHGFRINFSNGQHWDIANTLYEDFTWESYNKVVRSYLDHTWSTFGRGCTDCGAYYNGVSVPNGSVVGGTFGMPRADGGSGCDHRQILVDMWIDGPASKQ